MARKGYKTQEQQTEATKRYLDNNPEAKLRANRSRKKSTAKSFIEKHATIAELKELEKIIKSTKEDFKMIEIKGVNEAWDSWQRDPNAVRIYFDKNKKEVYDWITVDLFNTEVTFDDEDVVLLFSRDSLRGKAPELTKDYIVEVCNAVLNGKENNYGIYI